MILEHAWLTITEGQEAAFEAAIAAAFPIIESAPGCHGAEVRRCSENPANYALIVKWDSVDAHMVHFRTSDLYQEWKSATHGFYAVPPTITHFEAPIAR